METMESTTPAPTVTQQEQWRVESDVFRIYEAFHELPPNSKSIMLEIHRDEHIEFLTKALRQLGPSFGVLDANRPWLCYWTLHSLALLGESVDDDLKDNAVDFLSRCQDPGGGYGGGPGQLPHLATTYAAVNSLITLGGINSLSSIDRGKLYTFLLRMKDKSGGFRMHDGGEMDARACYTAISVASILNILDHKLVHNVGDYILSCQTYEGGISGEPGTEAHGGYTFCGLATMILIGEANRLDLSSLIDWAVFRQGNECGFQGRTNKLVDGCYSFWQGGVLALLQRLSSIIDNKLAYLDSGDAATDSTQSDTTSDTSKGEIGADAACHCQHEGLPNASTPITLSNIGVEFLNLRAKTEPLFHSMALQQYILFISQLPEGGFRDKPGKYRDYYHTCYCLSGLSVCQYSWSRKADSPPLPKAILGPYSNLLEPVHPLYNVVLDQYHYAKDFFSVAPEHLHQVHAK